MAQLEKEQGTLDRVTKTQEMVYEITVGEVMAPKMVSVGPDQTMSEFRLILRDNRISGTPVVENGKLVGMVSIEDLINALYDNAINDPVRERMKTKVECLYNDELLVHCIAKFSKYGYRRYPVMNRENELVGIITKGSIVEGLLRKLEIEYEQHETKVSLTRQRPTMRKFFEDVSADEISFAFKYRVAGQTLKDAGKAASELKNALKKLGVCPPLLRRIGVATYEAEINLASYTKGGEIRAQVEKWGITVEVTDNGPGIPDIALAMKPGYSTAPDWVRELGFGAGMGLVNMKKCSDEMDLKSSVPEGTHLTMQFYYTS
ncbi:MAG TPA: CBS domain-containing protein [Nitrospirota bacterium]|nr:CBS domain-containing protein [Nitrospirota bacterium]